MTSIDTKQGQKQGQVEKKDSRFISDMRFTQEGKPLSVKAFLEQFADATPENFAQRVKDISKGFVSILPAGYTAYTNASAMRSIREFLATHNVPKTHPFHALTAVWRTWKEEHYPEYCGNV